MLTAVAFVLLHVPAIVATDPASGSNQRPQSPRIVLDIPEWPTIFELNAGDMCHLRRQVDGRTVERDVQLIGVQEFWEPDYFTGAGESRTLRLAEVTVEVSGVRAKLLSRPYQMPVNVNGLRIYVEATRRWAHAADIERLADVDADVRLSAVAEGETWGPVSFVFPIHDYRWRSSSYFNTWNALVPYNKLYYHRGEDFGAIPDCLPVVSALAGRVARSPLPAGDGESNGLVIETVAGTRVEYYHMNVESMAETAVAGAQVDAGDLLGKTGMTWAGRRSQTHDPHLHFGLRVGETAVSTFPAIVESYFRAYPDHLMPIAGGYHFAEPGQSVLLDGSRSQARPGEEIATYEWRLHDGTCTRNATVQVPFEVPGLYSEELIVRTKSGAEARDYAQVRVYDRRRGRNMVTGWVYHHPVRGITPGQPVTFWNRLSGTRSDVCVDFGDGTPAATVTESTTHSFRHSGIFTVSFTTSGPDDEVASAQMCVVVESTDSWRGH
jgi:murein DD-endopeptidase MepM/ murein hydrolase activator NlpD